MEAIVGRGARAHNGTVVGAAAPKVPAAWITENDLPDGTFDGLSDLQKFHVLKALEDEPCEQGRSIAACLRADVRHPVARPMLGKVVALAKTGANAAQIREKLRRERFAETATAEAGKN